MRLGRGGGRARPRAAAAARAWGAAAALLLAVTGRAARVTAAGPGAPFAAAPFRQVRGNKQYSSAVTNPRGDVAVVVFHDDDDAEDNSVISNELRRLHGALLEKASPDGAVEFVAVDCSEQSNRFVCDDDAQVPVVPLLMVCRAHAGGGAGGPPCVPHHNPRSAASVGEAVLAALARAREIALAKALGYMHQEVRPYIARSRADADGRAAHLSTDTHACMHACIHTRACVVHGVRRACADTARIHERNMTGYK